MCGISGIVFRKAVSFRFAAEIAGALYNTQKHRGPNGGGMVFFDEHLNPYPILPRDVSIEPDRHVPYLDFNQNTEYQNNIKIVLCHNRLAVIDLSPFGHQPMCDPEKKFWITYNGEIYNHQNIKQSFFQAETFYSRSDTEVLLHLASGMPEKLDELNGMWAFALLDRQQKKLLLSRDRLGVKPLYYYHDERYFIFSSEVKALIQTKLFTPKLNEACIPFLLYHARCDFPHHTFYRGITPLSPSSLTEFDISAHEISQQKKYFQIRFSENPSLLSENSVRQTLEESVKRHLISDIPWGISLSGGADSSGILAMASAITGRPVECFSAVMPGFEKDESELIKLTTDRFQSTLNIVMPDANHFFSRLDELQYALDFPLFDGSTFAQFLVMEKARSSGIHVILGGQGSDEWNAGYAHHVFLHTAGQFWHHLADNLSYLFQSPIRYASTFAHVFYPKQIFLLKQRKRFDFIRKDVFDFSEFRDSLSADENLNESMMKDLTERRLPGFLRCEDRTSMHFGVESRPLFSDDKACMNLGMSMHPKQKVNGWHGKYLLKKALSGLVPEPVLWNKNKLAFSVPMYEWIKQNEKEILDYLKTSSDLIVRDKMPVGIDRDNYPYIARLYFFERWKKLFT